MKHSATARILGGFFVAVLAMMPFVAMPHPAKAAVSGWQKGVTLRPTYTGAYSDNNFKQSLSNAAAMHANYAVFEIPLHQSNVWSTDIHADWDTPTDQSLTDGVKYAQSLGMNTEFKVHLYSSDAQWAAYINPSDRSSWYANYQGFLVRYATLAQQLGVQQMVIGNELTNMSASTSNSTNTQNWLNMIAAVRGIYNGKLTYNANWGGCYFCDEKNHIDFWNALDYIGISAYYNLSDDMQGSWANYDSSDIRPLQQRWGKQIIFTEVGYISTSGARFQPWNSGLNNGPNQQEQSDDWNALLSYWSNSPYMAGVNIWDWELNPNAGGNAVSYTPQNKLAQTTISNWFGGSGGPPPPPPGAAFTATVAASGSVTAGQQANFSVQVTSTSQNVSNAIVDAEIYDSSNNRQLQQYFPGQNFSAGQAKSYTVSWTPPATGNYVFKLGVFSGDWSQNYYWNNSALNFSAATGSPPPPPGPGQVDVWWPANGATVSGVQPFKAMLQNYPVDAYAMYWQVDTGQLNSMYNSSQDYPHKEAIVDLSGWTWQLSGNYTVTFVAKDSAGNVLGQKSVTIHVTN